MVVKKGMKVSRLSGPESVTALGKRGKHEVYAFFALFNIGSQ